MVEQAKLDPSLVGVILKTINSAYYGLRCKISDVQHAITYLGFNQVYQLVVDHGVKSTMPDTPEFQELQCHSNVVSFFSFELARLCNKNKPLMHGTIGLLHDIGKSVILLLKKQHQKLAILIDLLDHARIGSLLLEKWNVPAIVYKSVEYQCFPEFFPPSEIPEEFREYAAVLYISHICYEYAKGSGKKELPVAFLDEYVTCLNFPEKSFLPLFKNHIMPSVFKKMNACPENVRKFLTESKTKILEAVPEVDKDVVRPAFGGANAGVEELCFVPPQSGRTSRLSQTTFSMCSSTPAILEANFFKKFVNVNTYRISETLQNFYIIFPRSQHTMQ